MSDLDLRIRERLAGFVCCEGYRNPGLDRARAAILAALGCHPAVPYGIVDKPVFAENGALRTVRPQLTMVCNRCNEAYPCAEVRFIAAALGAEVDVA